MSTYDFVFARSSGGLALQGYGLPADIDAALDARQELEELNTPGVDGSRYRKTRKEWPLIEVITTIACASYAVMLEREDAVQKMQGAIGQLTLGFGSSFRQWPRATLVQASTRRMGRLIGPENTLYSLELRATIRRQQVGK